MTYTITTPEVFLAQVEPFDRLSAKTQARIAKIGQYYRYHIGQPIAMPDRLSAQISIIVEGTVRLLGHPDANSSPVTLERLAIGGVIGMISAIRGVACESAIASTEVICLNMPIESFMQIVEKEPTLKQYFYDRPSLLEVFEILRLELERHPNPDRLLQLLSTDSLKDLALKAVDTTIVYPTTQTIPPDLIHWDWFVGSQPLNSLYAIGDRLEIDTDRHRQKLRPIGISPDILQVPPPLDIDSIVDINDATIVPDSFNLNIGPPQHIPYAPDLPLARVAPKQDRGRYPLVRGKGQIDGTVACFEMLANQFKIPFRRDSVRKVVAHHFEQTGGVSLQFCGAVADFLGLQGQLATIPISDLQRIQIPALIKWQDGLGVICAVASNSITIALPDSGLIKRSPQELLLNQESTNTQTPNPSIPILLIQSTRSTPQKKFGISWFWPSLVQYRGVLLEVLIASFFIQLFGLANPLITQTIVDKVLVQNSPTALNTLGILLVVVAVGEALLTSLRTYLFVDTTNRIDLALGSQIIDRLLRLPLRYFEKRSVGELSTRVNELENIRQFLTGTALTVVLDSVFSVVYIVVMLIYSSLLTLVALSTMPLFILLTTAVSPIARRQLRVKAERNARSQSHLVEVIAGIQTVKAQNVELRSRWKWQERYTSYVMAGFQTVITFAAAGSINTFLSQLSSLLVLWVGAYLVLDGKLTLGQLIAFRIISGYVTSPLLRLTQLWQNFQETALSLERIADILDTPMESDEIDRGNIPMPTIQGHVKFDNVSFRFAPAGALNLDSVSLEFPAGKFIGIVGQSGSGKSTLMKLLPRLYPLESGRILVDDYDISKVELYSLRQQIGIVPQDTLLFEGSVQENIALNYPDATTDQIIQAAKIAYAHEFIMELPNGYNSPVGERGSGLSGGQRQRIAIARTVLQNPRLLILDEATSALDYDSEHQVCTNIAAAFEGKTVFFITHRLTTIRNADIILMMDRGLVAELGTHAELMALKGRYYCLYQQQESQL
ncbi:peptidase domain-containing ABC transporter [Chamaesiphon sp. VAR_48_metabat_135_sub]|uniref:peptidase domain-containing ABC transporter n=1 Tax=Chamaesiphon sp. VAR_48_metabat_135_sub TaxID=2964699 RepID=UPI00286AD354|nr:peptidase domain-containing ABC transporter [Chamaesiphon sp. VAR_48_metabat_135_sub]